MTERQALQALLVPSANNIAAVLARWDAGSVDRFVAGMNAAARSLGMTQTHYTDPSGYDNATVSTAADQVRIFVLGQPRHNRITAGLAAADAMVDRIDGHRAVPGLPPRTRAIAR